MRDKEFSVDDKIKDTDGREGVITDIEDAHNIFVEYPDGQAIHCMVEGCELYSPIEKVKPQK
jgi:hypothetical protein